MSDGMVIAKRVDEADGVEPLFDMCLIRVIDETVSRGGIHMPVDAIKPRKLAIVLKVGPGRLLVGGGTRIPDPALVGKVVMVNPAAKSMRIDTRDQNQQLFLVDVEAIVAIDNRGDAQGLVS